MDKNTLRTKPSLKFDEIGDEKLKTCCEKFIDSHISVAVEKCLLCNGSNRNFYCLKCLRSGRFIYSNNALHKLNNTWKDKYRGR